MKKRKKFWVFDMDGTLTNALHDFPAIKRELGLPLDLDILTGLSQLDEKSQLQKREKLNQIEKEIAENATPSPGVLRILEVLKQNQIQVGILTRNNDQNTFGTLKTAGLLHYFDKTLIFTRDRVQPKPHPEGLFELQKIWNCQPSEMLMIGDYIYDLEVGKAAGTETVYIDPSGQFIYKEHATYCITQMDQILDYQLHLDI